MIVLKDNMATFCESTTEHSLNRSPEKAASAGVLMLREIKTAH